MEKSIDLEVLLLKQVSCLLCGKRDVRLIRNNICHCASGGIGVYQCSDCKVQFLYPQPTENELKEYYNGRYREEHVARTFYDPMKMDCYFLERLPEARKRVERHRDELLGSKDAILEIGCSCGHFLDAVKPYVASVDATEWDEKNAQYAASKGFVVKKDIQEFDHRFDKIFMFHVFEHIANPVNFLQRIKKYLNPGGKVYIEVPNSDDILLNLYDVEPFAEQYYHMAHLWYFNSKSLSYTVERSGFLVEIRSIQRYGLSNHLHWLKESKRGGAKQIL